MAFIHLVGGEKGGVGRSFYCLVLGQYHQLNKLPFRVVDADSGNPDVVLSRLDWDILTASLSNLKELVDDLVSCSQSHNVIVNLPPRATSYVAHWLKESGYASELYFWWLCNGSRASLRSLAEHLGHLNQVSSPIFVRNLGIGEIWNQFEDEEGIQALLLRYATPVVDFPRLNPTIASMLEIEPLLMDLRYPSHRLNDWERACLKRFLGSTFEHIEQVLQRIPLKAATCI